MHSLTAEYRLGTARESRTKGKDHVAGCTTSKKVGARTDAKVFLT